MSLDELSATPAAQPQVISGGGTLGAGGAGTAADGGPVTSGGQEQGSHIAGAAVGGDLSVENSIFNGDVYHYTEVQRRSSVRQITFADGREVREVDEQWAEAHFSGVEDEAEVLVRHLEERRVLLLTAAAGARKVTAATHVALRLRERGLCGRPPFVFDPVGRHLRLDLCELPLKHDEFQDRVVIFRYPLARGNPDLTRAMSTTDRAGWAQLADCLRQRNAYLVFTATPAEAKPFEHVHALQNLRKALAPHPPEVLGGRMERYLATLQARGDAPAESLDVLGRLREHLVPRFAFASQLTDFVDFYLGLGDDSLDVDQAHTLFQNAGKRLLHDLDDDFDGWSFGFTLALAHCAPDASGVPWVDFDRLRRHLSVWLHRDLRIPTGTRDGEEEVEPSEVRLELSDDTLFNRSRARVEKDPASLADMVHFSDGHASGAVWCLLLQHHRRVLTAILPRLRELAERTGADGRSLSVLAAQIIGRIGEIDYERIVVPTVERWVTLANGRYRGLIGAMFEGVVASDDSRYRARCLQHVRTLRASSADKPSRSRVEGAIACYAWLGWYDYGLAMGELYEISRAHLVSMIDDATGVSRVAASLEMDIQDAATRRDAQKIREMQAVLRKLVERIYAERGGIFLGVQHALVSVCAGQGVTPVLRELRGWIGRGGASMGVLLALMFVHERGIANQLHEDRTEFAHGDGVPAATCGQFVAALANGEEAVRQAARFLGDLFDSVTSPWAAEALVRRNFRERLQAHLLETAREAVAVPELVLPARSLFEQLARTHEGRLQDLIVQLVNNSEFTRNQELRAFATSLKL